MPEDRTGVDSWASRHRPPCVSADIAEVPEATRSVDTVITLPDVDPSGALDWAVCCGLLGRAPAEVSRRANASSAVAA